MRENRDNSRKSRLIKGEFMAHVPNQRYRQGIEKPEKGGSGSCKLIDRKTFEEGYRLWSTGQIPLCKFAEMCEINRNTLRYKLAFFYRMGYFPEWWLYDKDDPNSIQRYEEDVSDVPRPYKRWTVENGYED